MKHSKFDLSLIVDELGDLKARISELTAEEAKLKDILKKSGVPEIDGTKYRATVSTSTRETLDRDTVERLVPKGQFWRCLKQSTSTAVRVAALVRK